MANAQKLRGFVEAHPAVRRQREIEPINQVRADAAMREEPAVLKNIADAARLGPQIGRAIEQGAVADTDMPAIGPQQPRDHVEDARLAGARSEEHTTALQSLMRISYAVVCVNTKKTKQTLNTRKTTGKT